MARAKCFALLVTMPQGSPAPYSSHNLSFVIAAQAGIQ
jgi:hypothetical protein